jgi:hypothetical protein
MTINRLVSPCVSGFIAMAAAFGVVPAAGAAIVSYIVHLDGPSEFAGNTSQGYGGGILDYDNVAHTLRLRVQFFSLTGTTTASHIHAATSTPLTGTAGVATTTPSFVGFPLGVSSGSFDNTLDLTLNSSYNPVYVTANGNTTAGAELALMTAIGSGQAYWNIHSTFLSPGEIRGFIVAPSPGVATAAGVFGLGVLARRRRR